jgi:hypothetical protein
MKSGENQTAMLKKMQYVTDADGQRTAVIVPIDEFEELLEDLHLGRVARESINEPRRPFVELVEELRKAGEIDV